MPSLVPGLALLCCEGCHNGHVAAVVQEHVCQLHQAVSPGLPTFVQVWCLPKLHTEGLQQARLRGREGLKDALAYPAPGPTRLSDLAPSSGKNKCPHLLSGTGLPEEGTNDDTSVAVIQGEGELLLCLWDLGSGLLCLEEGVEQAKPGRTTRTGMFRLPQLHHARPLLCFDPLNTGR